MLRNPSPTHLCRALALAGILALTGCKALGPDFQQQKSAAPADWNTWHTGAPELRSDLAPGQASLPAQWWTVFKDSTLDNLEARAAQANFDLQTSALRFAQARVQRQASAAQRFPELNASGGAKRQRDSENGASTRLIDAMATTPAARNQLISILASPYNVYQAGFDASWELDLWGRVRRSIEAADAQAEGAGETFAQTRLAISSELARSYFDLRSVQSQLRVARQDIATVEENLNLTQARARGGLIDQTDVTRQSAQVADARARLPQLLGQEASAMNQIGTLVGAHPGELNDLLDAKNAAQEGLLPDLALGLPSDLARRRPDIRQAESKLHAATANIGVAEADLLPRITLGASFGLESLTSDKFGDWGSRRWSIGPSISLPIFDAGRRRSTVELRKLEQQEAAVNFQQTVLKAWQEVDDALNNYGAERRRNLQLREKQRSSQEAFDLANAKYKGGLIDFLGQLDAERTLLSANRDLADSDGQLRTRLVAVYKSVGGGGPDLSTAQAEPPQPTSAPANK